MRKKPMIYLVILILLATAAYSVLTYNFEQDQYVEINVLEIFEENKILFGNNCSGLVATTSAVNAKSINLGIEGSIDERPNTHDSVKAILNSYNITLEGVFITGKDDEYYYSDMVFNDGNKILKLDSMPSDAIAIALRTGSKIYVNKTLLEDESIDLCN